MIVSPDNIFPGAKITKQLETLYVIKVNAKSYYASTMTYPEFMEKFNTRLKGTTFTQFCKLHDVKSYKYSEGFEIEASEASRRDVAIENAKQSRYEIGKLDELGFIDYLKILKKRKHYTLERYDGKNKTIIIIAEREEQNFLLRVEKDYVLYSLQTGESIKISSLYDYNYKEIPWEKLSCYSKKEEEVLVKTA